MISKEEIIFLLKNYEAGTCGPEERALLEKWFEERGRTSNWQWGSEEERRDVQLQMRSNIEDRILPTKSRHRGVRVLYFKRAMVAASLLLCCITAVWFFRSKAPRDPVKYIYAAKVIKPGNHAAVLTLYDGSEISLEGTKTGVLYHKEGVRISRIANGELQYETTGTIATGNNKLSVPKGAEYRLILPDGTAVWLNSASSFSWPAAFTGKERLVALSGEGFFEVAKNSEQPFRVKARNTEIVVTGTRFNIDAYEDDDQVYTTLVDGGVNVSADHNVINLKPGQQAITRPGSNYIQRRRVDADHALAWMHGNFLFEDQDIRSIMREVARWYNVEVRYEGTLNPVKFGGTYSRSKSLEELLKYLESLSDIRFSINNNIVVVKM
jgi:ferric-dicitrate binding protein FerR (iron transport regulator)